LSASWFAAVQNATLATIRAGDVTQMTITGEVSDEDALMGIVNMLYDVGCRITLVESSGIANAPGALDATGVLGASAS
jgi:hypothetical protein